MFFDPDTRELLRTRPNPLTPDRARPAARRPPGRAAAPARRPSRSGSSGGPRNTGVIMVAGQKIALGRVHARQTVTVHVDRARLRTIDDGGDTNASSPGPRPQPVRSFKAHDPTSHMARL